MTYGWAILIVAIVMIALFQLGIFNGTNFTPHAIAGACQVIKNAQGSSLAGQCNNEQPKFVAQFNGASSLINVPINFGSYNAISIVAWIYPYSTGPSYSIIGDYPGILFQESGGQLTFWPNPCCTSSASYFSSGIVQNAWSFVAVTYTGGANPIYFYYNGAAYANPTVTEALDSSLLNSIGEYDSGRAFNGLISNLQIYNTSLSSNEINALYLEGIGGAPIDPTHIVGWWPLNGNANDYSENYNNGVPASVSYNGSWTSGYTLP